MIPENVRPLLWLDPLGTSERIGDKKKKQSLKFNIYFFFAKTLRPLINNRSRIQTHLDLSTVSDHDQPEIQRGE